MNFSGQKILMEIAELKNDCITYRNRIAHDVEGALELLINRYGETSTPNYGEKLIVTMDDMGTAAPVLVVPYRAVIRFFWDTPAARKIVRNDFAK